MVQWVTCRILPCEMIAQRLHDATHQRILVLGRHLGRRECPGMREEDRAPTVRLRAGGKVVAPQLGVEQAGVDVAPVGEGP